eukprot:564791-Alexandrium_andersonii.AAC.1
MAGWGTGGRKVGSGVWAQGELGRGCRKEWCHRVRGRARLTAHCLCVEWSRSCCEPSRARAVALVGGVALCFAPAMDGLEKFFGPSGGLAQALGSDAGGDEVGGQSIAGQHSHIGAEASRASSP